MDALIFSLTQFFYNQIRLNHFMDNFTKYGKRMQVETRLMACYSLVKCEDEIHTIR